MSARGSLRRRLMTLLSASILSAWLATAFFTYGDSLHEIDAMLVASGLHTGELRTALANSIATHLMHPLLVAVPLLGLVIWLAVSWGLAPLRSLATQVRARAPHNLEPVETAGPEEAQPLVEALNGLLGRVRDLLDRERLFTADAAHELRTPLAAIRTHAQVAANARNAAERADALAGVIQGTERAARLIEQLLQLARLDVVPELQPVNLTGAAAEVVTEYAGRTNAISIDIGLVTAAPAWIEGNPQLIAVLLGNLVDNAVRYGKPGGRVDVSVRVGIGSVELIVADDGPGIPPNQRARAFERFHRGLGTGADGSGLGLSIAARVAAIHGGRIDLSDGVNGSGLTATVSMPRLP